MFVSGATAVATVDDTPVNLITLSGKNRSLFIVNEGTVAGFFSIDGTNWARIPAGPSSIGPFPIIDYPQVTVQIKRVATLSNMTGVWAFTN